MSNTQEQTETHEDRAIRQKAMTVDRNYHSKPEIPCEQCGHLSARAAETPDKKCAFCFIGKPRPNGANGKANEQVTADYLKKNSDKAEKPTTKGGRRKWKDLPPEVREALRAEAAVITPEEQVKVDLLQQEFTMDDFGNADRFLYRHGKKFLHTQATGWLVYNESDGLWHEDATDKADQAMQDTIWLIEAEAALVADEKRMKEILKFAKASRSNARTNGALERAGKLVELARDFTDFDTHDTLFHCSNGEYDLELGKLLPHDPALLLTKGSTVKYDPTAKCPGLIRYLNEAMGGNQSLVRYIQRCAGYTLTAATGEAAMFIPTGIGGTGKTTFLTILHGILGSYAMRAERNMLMLRKGDEGQPFDYHGMQGCRALIASETEEGKHIAVSKVKELTGNEKQLRACKKFHDSYEFNPKAKVWLACNDFPKAPAGDESLWDRLKPVPFDQKFRGTDGEVKDLAEKLLAEEASGILNWMLRGLEEYMEIGLAVPDEAKARAQELRDEQDFLGRFLEENTTKTYDNAEMILVSKLYEVFKTHADITGEGHGWSRTKFNAEMRTKGYEDKKVRVGDKTPQVWVGLKRKYADIPTAVMGDVEGF